MSKCNVNKEKLNRDLGLYIHIPFCIRKCDYCDFLSGPATEEVKQEYVDALIAEIESYGEIAKNYVVPTIFIGGGTPSCISEESIARIMNTLSQVFRFDEQRFEATIEVNPGTLTKEKLISYQKSGINRLSFGLQSTKNEELKLLGRIHTYEEFVENYYLAREVGFRNINIDLMSALPGQTLSTWEQTLNKVIALNPEHISAYSLIIEEGTKFYEYYREGAIGYKELPDEEMDRLMYHRTKEILKKHGYNRYEISNYAKIGHECAHNSSYWIRTEYLGFGAGASSLLDGARFSKMHDIKQYIQLCNAYKCASDQEGSKIMKKENENHILLDSIGLYQDFEVLSKNQQMEEFMFLGLRMCKGISRNAFLKHFQENIEDVYGEVIKKLKEDQLMVEEGDNFRLTERGIDVSNSVLYVFFLN